MAIDKAIDSERLDGALKASADEIRAKTGDAGKVLFDLNNGTGFKAAIAAIQAGSGGGDSAVDDLLTREIVSIKSNAAKIGTYAVHQCKNLVSIDLPYATLLENGAFNACTALKNVNVPTLKTLDQDAFNGCTSIETLILPAAESIGTYAIRGCTALTKLDLHAVKTIFGSAFINCTVLETFIIRKTDGLANMYSTNIFNGTPILSGTGHIYVPASLVDDYKAQTNWAMFADQIRAIEDYPEITGG